MKTIVGRNAEIALMNEYVSSDRAEFVAVFGRRRVGKTFLVDSLFHDAYAFSVTGVVDGESEVQMQAFVDALEMYGYALAYSDDSSKNVHQPSPFQQTTDKTR